MLKKLQFEEFKEKGRAAAVVPVFEEVLADMETPVSVLERFKDEENVFLLESVEGGERWARYSMIGVNPHTIISEKHDRLSIVRNGSSTVIEGCTDALGELKKMLYDQQVASFKELPPFVGGAVGFIGYDLVRQFEAVGDIRVSSDAPGMCFMICDELIIFDNVRHTMLISVCTRPGEFGSARVAYDDARMKITKLKERLKSCPATVHDDTRTVGMTQLHPEMGKEEFMDMVRKGKDYIKDGEVIQLVLSQRFSAELTVEPLQIYRALRLINPSPYNFFLKFANRYLVGASPEELVKLSGKKASVRPIAGTRPRGRTEQEDLALASDMLGDEKERAEHIMLVDLGRNDLGRVALPGSVQVREFMVAERYSHVMHMVSDIIAELPDDVDCFDLLRATFPAGTLSGAPKVRAMQLIDQLEKSPRGIYGGAAGYFAYGGNMDMAIIIRSIVMNEGKLFIQAGAGIVADSDPEKEYMETLNKAQACFSALEFAAELDRN